MSAVKIAEINPSFWVCNYFYHYINITLTVRHEQPGIFIQDLHHCHISHIVYEWS